MIEKLMNDVRAGNEVLFEKEFEFAGLRREADTWKAAYRAAASRLDKARNIKVFEMGEVKIVSEPVLPKYPISPKKKFTVAVAAMAGLVLGIFIAAQKEAYIAGNRQ
jgi:uncharacterized protein involved in exopolysaccharide biosynthesis